MVKEKIFSTFPITVVVIVRKIKKIKFCEEIYKSHGYTVVKYTSLLSKIEKGKARLKYESNDNSVFINTEGNLVGVDLKSCSVLLYHGLPLNITTYFQDIGRLNRNGSLSFSILSTTTSAVACLKKILTIENFNTTCSRSSSVSTFSECSGITGPAQIIPGDINWIVPRSKQDDGYDIVEISQKTFLKILNKDFSNCLHNPYLGILDGIQISNCVYRCTNCLSKNALLNENLLRDVIKVYLNNKNINGNETEEELLENFYCVKKVFLKCDEERTSYVREAGEKNTCKKEEKQKESGDKIDNDNVDRAQKNCVKNLKNMDEILRKRKVNHTSETQVDEIVGQEIIKRKKNIATEEVLRLVNIETYKNEFRKLMSNKFMTNYVIVLKDTIKNQKSTQEYVTEIPDETAAVKSLQKRGLIPEAKECENGHEMKLSFEAVNRWKCSLRSCKKQVEVQVGTWFQRTRMSPKTAISFIYH
ncbi:Helicase, C-terminal domain and P-loop containing nucleoside triphosphate hydrolase domain-containing protein [Strongyloides ratti]|uniref:Helicase, C-terminal domain and P-loop containing nucleoside triphosphate hydrolase domain-containing protein n=1 Tax=Strongyloides ratti TaxID=34506 RepID=A0A090MNL9_STRRB|nr:Helicase, C-terminal domain and P-loop containing nucleoside triphosphate hydrolase domain-containing protein [Strongyloides ratti]CEF59661.1 Helicase, C-terminal domain and P-loop containing nucleoside triphosphate hydrolase domain-containing protein [Strongyloides ratti]